MLLASLPHQRNTGTGETLGICTVLYTQPHGLNCEVTSFRPIYRTHVLDRLDDVVYNIPSERFSWCKQTRRESSTVGAHSWSKCRMVMMRHKSFARQSKSFICEHVRRGGRSVDFQGPEATHRDRGSAG
jgi:hypothetical protein